MNSTILLYFQTLQLTLPRTSKKKQKETATKQWIRQFNSSVRAIPTEDTGLLHAGTSRLILFAESPPRYPSRLYLLAYRTVASSATIFRIFPILYSTYASFK